MCLIGLKEMYVLKFIILPDSSLPPAPSLGGGAISNESRLDENVTSFTGLPIGALQKPRTSASSFVDPDFFSLHKSCNFDECC